MEDLLWKEDSVSFLIWENKSMGEVALLKNMGETTQVGEKSF